ncbi:Arm DNA-binding domain-containing protein [Stenotrophomonas chelatiphaga]|uniref:Arm DNA-binding domain-containing protein n=1 Tax=Stenotrophomonas chelatiphaga TaxID=517011 RepID=UPI003CCC9627
MSSVLTKRIVFTAEPRDRPHELRDAQVRGMILRVEPSGHKAWIVTWAHGKRRTVHSVEHLSLDQACDQARQAVAEYVQSGLPTVAKTKPPSCSSKRCSTITLSPGRLLCSRRVVSTRTASDRCFRGCYAVSSSKLTCAQWRTVK